MVLGSANSGGSISEYPAYVVTFVKIFESLESLNHLLNPQRTQKSVYFHTLGKSYRLFQFVDNGKISALANIYDDDPRRVGPDVDNSYFFHKFHPSLFLPKKPV